MIPVLSLNDPVAGAAFLGRHLGFVADPSDPLLLDRAGQRVRLVHEGSPPAGLLDLPFDHLAIRVADVDAAEAEGKAAGAELHPGFTPDGPREIAEFGPTGVRYVFFRGPGGWPFEFIAPRRGGDGRTGHDHFGVRCPSVPDLSARLTDMGATTVATHSLGAAGNVVNVAFLRLGETVFELFDEPPCVEGTHSGGWIGFVR